MPENTITPVDLQHSGFSMVELMVVIAILAVLATVAIPEMSALLKNTKLRTATRQLVSTLQEMKLRAIKENAVTSIAFDEINDSYKAFVDNDPADPENGVYEKGEEIIAYVDLKNDNLEITSNNSSFGFTSRGLLTGVNNCTITISNTSGRQKHVKINKTGRIRTE